MPLKRFLLSCCLLIAASCITAFGQSTTATLSGTVTDQNGAIVPGVAISAINPATSLERTATTSDAGYFSIPLLPPGTYTVTAKRDGFAPLRAENVVLNVGDQKALQIQLKAGDVNATVQVLNDAPLINESPAVSTVIDRQFVENLPLNGRSFNTLLQLTPGVAIVPTNGFSPGQFSVAGQRSDANNFTVDGVSANFGVGSSLGLGGSGTGTGQAFSALGGTSSLVSVEALQEFRVETSSFAPEFGRSPGAQVILTTRSGTNDFHGGGYDYLRNTVMDANNWFANSAGLQRAPEHHNDFGAYVGGPILKNKTFFFFSYEGARLRQPQTVVHQVPSNFARSQASASLAPFLNAYPLPTGAPASPTAFTAPLTASFSNAATLNAVSVRIDHTLNSRYSVFGRYNNAPSSTLARGLNNPQTTSVNTRTLTFGVNTQFASSLLNTVRANYSSQGSSLSVAQDSTGGGVPIDQSLLLGMLPAASTFITFSTGDTYSFALGVNADNRAKQFNITDDLSWILGAHALRFGADFREIYLDKTPFQHELLYSASTVQGFLSSGRANLFAATAGTALLSTKALSLYAQDTWKISPRLTLTYGLRWELSPPPAPRGSTILSAWTNVNNPAQLALAPLGSPLWATTHGNFAPRFGIAYGLNKNGSFLVRGGVGIFYDLGVAQAVELASSFPNFLFGSLTSVAMPPGNLSSLLPVLSTQPPYAGVQAYDPNMKLPRSYQWNVSLERSFRGKQVVSATYVGQAGRDLIRAASLFQPNASFTGNFLLRKNDAYSNYDALQIQYRLRLSHVQALLNYTWSHSLDNASDDVVAGPDNTVIPSGRDYSSSSFDVRQSFSGAITYAIPGLKRGGLASVLTKDWSVDTVVVARAGFPFNALIFGVGVQGVAFTRPDLVPGQPVWISNPLAPGGKTLNASAFSVPATVRQGTEGRNDIPGFGLVQVDFSIRRKFAISERVGLQFRADAFNLFNHPNFLNPAGFIQFGASFLRSASTLNQGLGGQNPLFQQGGPRSLQMSLKLMF
jgi:carboxypeptidase family protein/TonB-dependent receptor-like protein